MPTLAAKAETCAYERSVESAVKRIYLFFVWQLDMSMRIWSKDNEDWWVMALGGCKTHTQPRPSETEQKILIKKSDFGRPVC